MKTKNTKKTKAGKERKMDAKKMETLRSIKEGGRERCAPREEVDLVGWIERKEWGSEKKEDGEKEEEKKVLEEAIKTRVLCERQEDEGQAAGLKVCRSMYGYSVALGKAANRVRGARVRRCFMEWRGQKRDIVFQTLFFSSLPHHLCLSLSLLPLPFPSISCISPRVRQLFYFWQKRRLGKSISPVHPLFPRPICIS